MGSLNTEINKFINNNLILSQKDISSAVKSREWLINRIVKKISEKSDGPQLYSENGLKYIQFGSYFKGTKVSNVDEFDIMFIVDSKNGVFSVNGDKIGEGIGSVSPNPKYDKKYKKEDGSGVSSRKILNWLYDIIIEVIEPYGGQAYKDKQAVTVYISSKSLHIDFVPGGIFQKVGTTSPDDVFYIIPKGDINSGWIETNPRVDKKIIKDKSDKYKQFKNTIRLFKYLFKESYNVKISSYAVESALVSYTDKSLFFDDYDYDFIGVLLHIISLVEEGKIPDMRDNNINLLDISLKDNILMKLISIKSKYYALDKESRNFPKDVEDFLKNE